MESKVSLRTPRQPSISQGWRPSRSRPSTMQTSWSSHTSVPTKKHKAANSKDLRNLSRPHTTGGVSRPTSRNPSHAELFMEGMTPLRTRSIPEPERTLRDYWVTAGVTAKVARPQSTQLDQRPSAIAQRPHTSSNTTRFDSNVQFPSKSGRPHTATGDSRTTAKTLPPSTSFKAVKSYSSPSFSLKALSPPNSPSKQSIFDARSLKYPKNLKESPNIDNRGSSPSRAMPAHHLGDHVLDPSLNLRSPSISVDFKVQGDNLMQSLVTQLPLPPPPPTPSDSSTPSFSPSTASKMLRKQIEAALRMYPRNTWGPVTKWGYQEDLPPGPHQEKNHFIKDKEKLEKQRLESRSFGHKRNWVKFKTLTNFWEQHEARQSMAYADEKERFLTDSETMLHIQNDNRIARAKGIVNARRETNKWREFKRLEAREGEFIDRMEVERRMREECQTRTNDSGVVYNIVTLAYPNNYEGDLLRFEDAKISWRQCMRALRIQSKRSGARMYNVLNWKPHKPCCVPPPVPHAPQPPDPTLEPSPRKPKPPVPKNMLHLEDKCNNVPVGCTNDMQTNW